ncbi:hypothetical protein Asp14428_35190 [Actinoplanes sp. NBRC 14428]|uniref:Prepilin-type N-terminal cleavage/methylation domain-containing protein n=1 Tax=Pseudosporangium ferrugineum TaxID=439699 RepID=A0A2T0S3C0_9ACTN|nr:prepilin-type N-terminal cleavage/methylation domain-containing protein [Pseudosporangium ferrugineum]PRY27909.1 prepilin-type N-terminal cleavage/methylation domain-containing protein [Pseudosporangium ferrugineum]BCJ52044.1 hypothetical protein Asp14428_35190 [Actinoplanes sp. NBRC 14428]
MTRAARPERDDAGFSLAEVLVTMGLMGVVMMIFTGAILQVYRTNQATETLTEAQGQLATAFQRFDRELRYASWISTVGQVGTRYYVEFAGADPTQCRQLRLETAAFTSGNQGSGLLQLLSWTKGSPPASTARGQTIASQIVTTGVPPFFTRQLANEAPYASPSPSAAPVGADYVNDFQRLRVRLTTRSAAGKASIDVTFTALNTSRLTPAANDCSEGRPTT